MTGDCERDWRSVQRLVATLLSDGCLRQSAVTYSQPVENGLSQSRSIIQRDLGCQCILNNKFLFRGTLDHGVHLGQGPAL